MTDIRYLHVHVAFHVDDDDVVEVSESIPIPPDYTAVDTAALTARKVEDTAFRLNRQTFGRRPTLDALVAAAARLRGLELLRDGMPDGDLRDRITDIFDLTNADATAMYGEDPDGS